MFFINKEKSFLQQMIGFSLIELLFVLTIVGVLAALGMTSLQSFHHRAQAQLYRAQLLRAIQYTRNAALTRNEKIILCGSADQKHCSGQWKNGFIIVAAVSGQLLYSFAHSSAQGVLHVRNFRFQENAQFIFLSTGLTDTDNSTFWYCSAENSSPDWAIVINKTGRIRMINGDSKKMKLVC